MNEFLLIFRRDYKTESIQPTAQDKEKHIRHWQKWYGDLISQNVMTKPIQRIEPEGIIVSAKAEPTVGPILDGKKSIGGYITIQTKDYETAVEIAKGCPILELSGHVEIRRMK
tara:strand:+ start:34445 stop:34783 length:339 start_codon:yes stop_codon:yes gene_type:complete